MPSNPFEYASGMRDKITAKESQEIQQMYVELGKKIDALGKKYGKKDTASAPLQQMYYTQLKKQVEAWSKELSNGVYSKVTHAIGSVSDAVVKDNAKWLESFGFDKDHISAAFSNVNQSVVNSIVTGKIYGNKSGSWSLSKSIWGDNEKNLKTIYRIVAEGMTMQMGVQEIAENLRDFVDPTKKLDWTGPDGIKIYGRKTDYNAQRLVRTLSQHAYQKSVSQVAWDNPFISKIRWIANGSRVCEICKKRNGKVYALSKLPLDHPNGMCVMDPVIDDDITDQLAGWVNGKETKKTKGIDKFADLLGYDKDELAKSLLKTPNKPKVKPKAKPKVEVIDKVEDAVDNIDEFNKWFSNYKKKINAAIDSGDYIQFIESLSYKVNDEISKTVDKYFDVLFDYDYLNKEEFVKYLLSDEVIDGIDVSSIEDKVKKLFESETGKKLGDFKGSIFNKVAKSDKLEKVASAAKKTAPKFDDNIDDAVKAAKKAIGELDDQVKSIDNMKKDIISALSEYDNDSIKKFKQVKKAQLHDGLGSVYKLVEKYNGFDAKIKFANKLDSIADKYYDDLIDVFLPSLKDSQLPKANKKTNILNKLLDAYTDSGEFSKEKLAKLQDAVDELDDLFEKNFDMTPKKLSKFNDLNDELSTVKNKLIITKAEIKTQKAIAKGATKEFAGKSYDEALAWFKNESMPFYKHEVIKKSDDFVEAIDDVMKKAKTDDIKKAFSKYSSGSIKSEKFDSLLTKLDDYKSGKIKVESSLKKFTADDFTDKAKSLAKLYENRQVADKDLRKWLDSNWDVLDNSQKFSVWKYTENSNPMNKPLSGYANGSWRRENFVGVGNADWGTEDDWRQLGNAFAKKFGKNGTKNIDHAKAIADLTTAIDNMEMPSSMYLFRGSDYNGLAGWFEGSGLGFDDMLELFENGSKEDLKALKGMTVQNHAFTSTAIASDSGFGGEVKYKIYAPKGTRGIYAEPQSYFGKTVGVKEALYKTGQDYSGVGGEAEIILQRGTEFRITDIEKTGNKINIEMEIVDQPRYFDSGYEQTINSGATLFKH